MNRLLHITVFFFCVTAFSQSNIREVGALPETIGETSGLIFHNGRLITHNDSGNTPQLFELDTVSLQVTRTVTIENAQNVDWEDLAQDDDFIYIGDFGNNLGNRQDLVVLKIAKAGYDVSDTVTAEQINFSYEDQIDFTATQDSDWDAEAFFAFGDFLIVLTKQWQSQGTVAYRIPKVSGSFVAERLDSYQVDGLITGATYGDTDLFIVGYSQFLSPFFVRIADLGNDEIFSGAKTKTTLTVGQAQMEAITQTDSNTFYTTSEAFSNAVPIINSSSRLFAFDLDMEEMEEVEDPEDTPLDEDRLILYKATGSSILNYRLNTDKAIFGMGIFDSTGRLLSYTPLERLRRDGIDISSYTSSIYYLAFFLEDRTVSQAFYKE